MFARFRIAKAHQACVNALRPLVARPSIGEPWPAEFWGDPFVLGYFVSAIGLVADVVVRRRLPTDEGGRVVLLTLKDLGGYTPDLAERIGRLSQERNSDFVQGARSAEKVTAYMLGSAAFDHDPDIEEARQVASALREAMGTRHDEPLTREAIAGALAYLKFTVPVERRLGIV